MIIIISSDELAKEIEDQKSKGVEGKEKLVQKEGEAAMLASINKQVTSLKIKNKNSFYSIIPTCTFHRHFDIGLTKWD